MQVGLEQQAAPYNQARAFLGRGCWWGKGEAEEERDQ